jgi:hypothetical protein
VQDVGFRNLTPDLVPQPLRLVSLQVELEDTSCLTYVLRVVIKKNVEVALAWIEIRLRKRLQFPNG